MVFYGRVGVLCGLVFYGNKALGISFVYLVILINLV